MSSANKPDPRIYEMGQCLPVRRTSDGSMSWVGKEGQKQLKYKRKDVTYWECSVRVRSKKERELIQKQKELRRREQINESILEMSNQELEDLVRRCVQKLSKLILKCKSGKEDFELLK